MGNQQCGSNLAELEAHRKLVQASSVQAKTANDRILSAIAKASSVVDFATLDLIENEWAFFHGAHTDFKVKLNLWETKAKKFRGDVLKPILEKAKKDKKNQQLSSSCAEVIGYVDSVEAEIKSGHELQATMDANDAKAIPVWENLNKKLALSGKKR
jgi:hypothetical protein